MSNDEHERLVTTSEAARALGISARTLQRYVQDGLVTPEVTLPRPQRPQYRWNVPRLREQIKSLSAHND